MKITQPLILLSQLAVNQGTSLNDHGSAIQSSANSHAPRDTSSRGFSSNSRPQCDFSFASLLKHPQCEARPNTHLLGLKRDDFMARTGLNEEQLNTFLNLNGEELAMRFGIQGNQLGKPDQFSNWDRLKFAAKFLCGMAIGLWGLGIMRRAQAVPLAPAAPPPGQAAQAAAGG